MELLDIGKELKTAREQKGISLEKVHEDTRIGINFLQSLEQGKIEHLPYPVYARGFVRSYAKYLGLDSERIANDFSTVFRAEDQFEKLDLNDLPTSLHGPKMILRSQNNVIMLGIALVVVIVLGLGWYLYSSYNSGPMDQTQAPFSHDPAPEAFSSGQTGPYVSEGPQGLFLNDNGPAQRESDPTDLVEPEIEVEPAEDALPEELASEPETLHSLALNDETDNASPEATGQSTLPGQESLAPEIGARVEEEAAPPVVQKTTLVIRASEDCWLRLIADESSEEAYLRPGESLTVEFEDHVQLTLGNAGGVDIFLDGDPYPFEAVSGQVKTLKIPSPDNHS